jgi:hypothetical protein
MTLNITMDRIIELKSLFPDKELNFVGNRMFIRKDMLIRK